ncbi:MAG: hypothetical protein ACPG7E_04255 [Marinirhabdus sp.]
MKKRSATFLAALLLCTLQSCLYFVDNDDDDIIIIDPPAGSAYEPLFLDRAEFEASLTLGPEQPIVDSGKIYVFNDLLFVNEKNKGFHVFQNTDPSNPQPVHFIDIPGATDIAAREGVFYVNQAVDLVAISFFVNGSDLHVSKRIKEVFPPLRSPDGFFAHNVPEGSIVIDWKLKN